MSDHDETPENDESKPKLTIEVDADYDFDTGIFTPKCEIVLPCAGTVIFLGDVTPPEGYGQYYLTRKTYSGTLTIKPRRDDESED